MRIGIMLRAYDRPGGIGIYSRNIVKHLLRIDKSNHYVLMYNNQNHLGSYNKLDNVDEVFIPPTNQIIWDQWRVRKMIKKWEFDLVFHTKFTVPLFAKTKKIMALHGASWFVNPEVYGKFDLFYVNKTMPIYCRNADFLISNSDNTTNDFIRILKVPPEKITTVHLAAGDEFIAINDSPVLEKIRNKYSFPDRFILTVTSYASRKNFSTLLKSFKQCYEKTGIHLVVVGKNCEKYIEDFNLRDLGLDQAIHFPGWIEQGDLPAIYNLASAFVFPSVIEEFGIPIVEAMACGCPIAASNTGAIPEISNGAALLCAPHDDDMLTQNILKILTSTSVAKRLRERGLERAKHFSWNKTAQQTLEILNRIHG